MVHEPPKVLGVELSRSGEKDGSPFFGRQVNKGFLLRPYSILAIDIPNPRVSIWLDLMKRLSRPPTQTRRCSFGHSKTT